MYGSFGNFISLLALQLILPNFLSYSEAYHAKHSPRTRPRVHHSYINSFRRLSEQQTADDDSEYIEPTHKVGQHPDEAYIENRNSTVTAISQSGKTRLTPSGVTHEQPCDHLATSCLHAYRTGKLCGRTIAYKYETFDNYCMLDYVNCMEGEEVWQTVHMGECYNSTRIDEYINYPYHDDFFLDQYYVVNDH